MRCIYKVDESNGMVLWLVVQDCHELLKIDTLDGPTALGDWRLGRSTILDTSHPPFKNPGSAPEHPTLFSKTCFARLATMFYDVGRCFITLISVKHYVKHPKTFLSFLRSTRADFQGKRAQNCSQGNLVPKGSYWL